MAHVFISYRRTKPDKDFAAQLKEQIEKAGFEAKIDTEFLAPGEDWRESIDSTIRSAFALVVVMTEQARKSEYVTYEWSFAWGNGIKVIPILLEKTELHPRLAAFQYLDFTDRFFLPWDKLIERLIKLRSEYVSRDAVEQAKKLLIDPDEVMREKGVKALLRMKAYTVLIEMVQKSPYPDVSTLSAIALEKHNNAHTMPVLVEGIYYPRYRTEAAFALKQIGEPCLSFIVPAIKHHDTVVRQICAEISASIQTEESINLLTNLLTSETSTTVLTVAINGLGNMKASEAIPVLMQLQQHSDRDIRRLATWAIGQTEDDGAIEGLVAALGDNDESVIATAGRALEKMVDRATPQLLETLRVGNTDARRKAIRLIRMSDKNEIISELILLFRNESEYEIQKDIGQAIYKFTDNSNLPLLIRASYDSKPLLRYYIAIGLSKIQDSKAIERLIEMSKDKDVVARRGVIYALATTHNEDVISVLLEALTDSDYDIRFEAYNTLNKNFNELEHVKQALDQYEQRGQNNS